MWNSNRKLSSMRLWPWVQDNHNCNMGGCNICLLKSNFYRGRGKFELPTESCRPWGTRQWPWVQNIIIVTSVFKKKITGAFSDISARGKFEIPTESCRPWGTRQWPWVQGGEEQPWETECRVANAFYISQIFFLFYISLICLTFHRFFSFLYFAGFLFFTCHRFLFLMFLLNFNII